MELIMVIFIRMMDGFNWSEQILKADSNESMHKQREKEKKKDVANPARIFEMEWYIANAQASQLVQQQQKRWEGKGNITRALRIISEFHGKILM